MSGVALFDDGERPVMAPGYDEWLTRDRADERGNGPVADEFTCGEPSVFCAPRFAHLHKCNQPLISGRCVLHGASGADK